MGFKDLFQKGAGRRTTHVVGHIADDPQVVTLDGTKYMVFHLEEAAGTEFHLKMLPTTPKRRKGDRVEITWASNGDGPALVEALYAAPDSEALRRRNQEYLHNIESQQAENKH
jgi:hypothetical protein